MAFFAHKGVRLVSLGWIAFILENLVMSQNREYIIDNFGDDQYHLAYNTLSTLACGYLCYGYFRYGRLLTGPPIKRTAAKEALGTALHIVGLVGFSQLFPAFQIPVMYGSKSDTESNKKEKSVEKATTSERKLYVRCPIDFNHDRKVSTRGDEVVGMERISRHPGLWFLGISTLGSACTSIYPARVAAFSFPIVIAFIGSEHQDYRFRRNNGGVLTPEKERVTSNIPFLAILQGKQSMKDVIAESKGTNTAIACLVAMIAAARRLK